MATKSPKLPFSAPISAPILITAESLFHRSREVLIEHAGQAYRLRITTQNKLILTK